ncbi:reverse transcriptase domain-containing protein [Tanacetum coccineum]
MDDEPIWAADRVVAPTPGSAITIPETANEFAIKGNSNSDTGKIKARMDAMTMKMDAHYKELQSRTKQPTSDLYDHDIPMSHEEEAKSMQTFSDYTNRLTSSRTDFSIFPVWKQLNLGVGIERMIFNIDSAMKHSYSNDDTCFSIDVIDEILEEDFDALLDEGSKILHSIEGTLLEEEIFLEFNEFIAMAEDENSESESDTEEPPFEKITINTDYKIKTSLKEPPTDLELKPLPENLEYVFLEEPSFLPVIISSQLSAQKKSKLVSVLKQHKEAFAWKTTDIPGICPSFCKHKIQLLDDKKPVVQKQRRLNPNMQEVDIFKFLSILMIKKNTFTCPFRTYVYRRMPFRLCNAPATFQRCMMAIFHDMIEESVEVFMDDFSVFGNSFDKCLNNLDKMIQRCKYAHLVLNWEKCHFMVKEGIVLGHNVFGAGLEVDRAKINVISKLLPPTNIKEINDRKGTENVVANHLSQIENDESSDDSEVDDNFPGETLWKNNTKDEPWYADIGAPKT